jgi:hypothetical protein
MIKSFSKLDKHTKIALFVAPILLILGFAAADMWAENDAQKIRFYEMAPANGNCDILAKDCILQVDELQISIYIENGITTANATFPLDTMTMFVVDQNGEADVFRMGMKDSPYYWYQKTDLENQLADAGSQKKVRFVATIDGGQYIAEFTSRTAG